MATGAEIPAVPGSKPVTGPECPFAITGLALLDQWRRSQSQERP